MNTSEIFQGLPENRISLEIANSPTIPELPIHNPNFLKWLANSVVVDRNKLPLVVYHGTGNKTFSKFDPEFTDDVGFHFGNFSQAVKVAESWVKYTKDPQCRIIPCFLSLKNPLSLSDIGKFQDYTLLKALLAKHIITKSELNYLFKEIHHLSRKDSNLVLLSHLQKKGYDGFIYKNSGEGRGLSYAVFNPNQIKSALINNGNFDTHSDDIYC